MSNDDLGTSSASSNIHAACDEININPNVSNSSQLSSQSTNDSSSDDVIHEDFVLNVKAGNSGDEWYSTSADTGDTTHTVSYPEKVLTSPSQGLEQVYEEVKVDQK